MKRTFLTMALLVGAAVATQFYAVTASADCIFNYNDCNYPTTYKPRCGIDIIYCTSMFNTFLTNWYKNQASYDKQLAGYEYLASAGGVTLAAAKANFYPGRHDQVTASQIALALTVTECSFKKALEAYAQADAAITNAPPPVDVCTYEPYGTPCYLKGTWSYSSYSMPLGVAGTYMGVVGNSSTIYYKIALLPFVTALNLNPANYTARTQLTSALNYWKTHYQVKGCFPVP
jgi:hypothetical protein